MPLTEKDALELIKFQGLDDAEDLEAAKTRFQSTYYNEDQIHASKELLGKFTGKTMGSALRYMVKEAREDFGDELNAKDLEKMPIEQAFTTVRKMYNDKLTTVKTELESKIGVSSEQAVKDLQEKYSKLENKLKEEQGIKGKLQQDFEGFKTQAMSEKQDILVKYHKNELFSKITPKFDKSLTPLAIKGFHAEADEELKFLTDETGKPYLADASGKRFPSKKKAGEFMTDEEALEAYAESKGVLQKNPKGGMPAFTKPGGGVAPPTTGQVQPTAPGTKSKVSPRAW